MRHATTYIRLTQQFPWTAGPVLSRGSIVTIMCCAAAATNEAGSLKIVLDASAVPIEQLTGFDSCTEKASSGSNTVSPAT
jgi:hypothetical protein